MLNFVWKFNDLAVQREQQGLNSVMVSVRYRLCATDQRRSVYRYGEISFAPADSEHFTPYDEISKETMIAFAEQTLGESLDTLKAEMIAEHAASPIENRPLPWEVTRDDDV